MVDGYENRVQRNPLTADGQFIEVNGRVVEVGQQPVERETGPETVDGASNTVRWLENALFDQTDDDRSVLPVHYDEDLDDSVFAAAAAGEWDDPEESWM